MMLNQSQKRSFVTFVTLGLAAASFSLTAGLLNGVLTTPIPLVTGFTVRDLLGIAGLLSFYLLYKREV
jgi:hypothetical protein